MTERDCAGNYKELVVASAARRTSYRRESHVLRAGHRVAQCADAKGPYGLSRQPAARQRTRTNADGTAGIQRAMNGSQPSRPTERPAASLRNGLLLTECEWVASSGDLIASQAPSHQRCTARRHASDADAVVSTAVNRTLHSRRYSVSR